MTNTKCNALFSKNCIFIWFKNHIHRDPAIFGDWAPRAYRKLRKRKLRGYCYVVICTDDRKNTEIFEKTENCEAIYM